MRVTDTDDNPMQRGAFESIRLSHECGLNSGVLLIQLSVYKDVGESEERLIAATITVIA